MNKKDKQNTFGLGCLPGKKDVRDFKIKKKAMAIQFPESFECSQKTHVKNQGAVGSCVAHSTSEILECLNPDAGKLSTNFIYGNGYNIYKTEGPGMLLRDACNIALKYGDPKVELCPGNTEVIDVYEIASKALNNSEVLEDASKRKISSYAALFTNDDIKFALMNYGPVLGAVTWFNDNEVDRHGNMKKGTQYAGGHAIMVKGWNKDGWLIQNSWGTSWGNKGNFILSWDYKLEEAYSFVPSDRENDIKKTVTCKQLDWFFKIINNIVNIFNKNA